MNNGRTGSLAPLGATLACGLVSTCLACWSPAAHAQAGKTYVMKLSTATINDTQHEWLRRFAAAVEKNSGGRIKGEIYPASQLGAIPRQIEGTQFGAIQCAIIPPEFFVGVDERFEVLASPGLARPASPPSLLPCGLASAASAGGQPRRAPTAW